MGVRFARCQQHSDFTVPSSTANTSPLTIIFCENNHVEVAVTSQSAVSGSCALPISLRQSLGPPALNAFCPEPRSGSPIQGLHLKVQLVGKGQGREARSSRASSTPLSRAHSAFLGQEHPHAHTPQKVANDELTLTSLSPAEPRCQKPHHSCQNPSRRTTSPAQPHLTHLTRLAQTPSAESYIPRRR